MSRHEWPADGWFYRQAGRACGPVPAGRLKVLLAVGLLRPRQAVWQRSSDGLRFVHAATAACGTTHLSCPPSPSERVPA